jgi:hypothetical protein
VTKPAPSILRRIVSWVILILVVAILVWALGGYIKSFVDIPWWVAAIGGVAILAGIIGYQLGTEAVYKRFCEPLGYHCELRPDKGPRSARHEVELVISGDFRGRTFKLYREYEGHGRSALTQRAVSPTAWGVLEWAGDDIRLAKLTQYVNLATKTVYDALDPRIAQGIVEAGPGLMVIRQRPGKSQELWVRQGRFPLPWDIEEFVKNGDDIRRVFMP